MHGVELDIDARRVAEEFVGEVVYDVASGFREGLVGAYLIGSLAHGGFSRRYSDIDVAFVAEAALKPAQLEFIREAARARSDELAQKLSIFWTDRSFSVGRFPVLDRLDLLDYGRVVLEREVIRPQRPALEDVWEYLVGRPFTTWVEKAQAFATADVLPASERKAYLRALLYPARFLYSWTRGAICSNDCAVEFLRSAKPAGVDIDLIDCALRTRQAAADPDDLFPQRARLLHQVEACSRWMSRS